jgi:ArsR family transcriptional regulator
MTHAQVYRALGSEQRLKLLRCLSEPKNVSDLLCHCSLTQSALSQHLRVLRDAGLVVTRKKGKEIEYHVRDATVTRITNLLLDFS